MKEEVGLFETMRSYHNKIIYLDEHLERIRQACKIAGIKFPYTFTRLKRLIQDSVKINAHPDAYVRLTLWKSIQGTGCLIYTRQYKPLPEKIYRNGFSACVSNLRQDQSLALCRLKTTNRSLYELSYQKAKERGFDEAIILNKRGHITEASRSNIFFIKGKELFTPGLECGCLDGITRKVIFDLAKKYKIRVCEGSFGLSNLHSIDESFLTNSLEGIMPLVF